MLSQKQAHQQALMIFNEFYSPDRKRLDRIKKALNPPVDSNGIPVSRIELPEDSPPLLHRLAAEAETNYLPLLIETYVQVMVVDGYITRGVVSRTDDGTPVPRNQRDPWETWQRNRMDSRQLSLTRSACSYGTAYGAVVPGRSDDGEDYAAVRINSPLTMTAIYEDEEMDDWPIWGLSVTDQHWVLYGDSEYHIFGLEDQSLLKTGSSVAGRGIGPVQQARSLAYIESREHPLGVTPIIRYRDRHYLPDETVRGMVEPLLSIQRRIDRTSVNQMVAQQIAIFRQKYSIGWSPESEEEEIKSSIARMHYIDRNPEEVELGEWEATDIEPYISAGNQARRDFAATGQIPAQSMGIDGISNISDATLAGLEAAKNRRSGIVTTSLGESHEQLLRTFAAVDGNTVAAQDFSSEVIWRDFESRSFAQTVDGILKLVEIGLPADIAMEDVPGFSGQKLERVRKAMRLERSREALASAIAPPPPAANPPTNTREGEGGSEPPSIAPPTPEA